MLPGLNMPLNVPERTGVAVRSIGAFILKPPNPSDVKNDGVNTSVPPDCKKRVKVKLVKVNGVATGNVISGYGESFGPVSFKMSNVANVSGLPGAGVA